MLYYVGIDFGHGETTVSRVPGYNGNPVSQISLKNTNDAADKKIISAVCKDKYGKWSLVNSSNDYSARDLREGFKAMVNNRQGRSDMTCMSERDKESMREFAKLIFKAIREHDTDLRFDPESGEKNFELGIACPSDWTRQDSNAQQDYLDFFRNECGLPVDHCIKESDAAFFSKFSRYANDDSVFVIDLGSSTIDFTTYSRGKCITSCCWGESQGAHKIDDALVSVIKRTGDNAVNIEQLNNYRKQTGFGDCFAAISLLTRRAKELYYLNNGKFSIAIPFSELSTEWSGDDWALCIKFKAERDEYDKIIDGYVLRIREILKNAKIKLNQNGIFPNRILLSGGACRMNFVQQYVKEIFQDAQVDIDPQPECVVSNGIALYAERFNQALRNLLDNLRGVNFETIYKEADTEATLEAIKELVPSVVSRVKDYTGCTGNQMRNIFCNFIKGLDENNATFKNLVLSKLKSKINAKAKSAIEKAYMDVYKRTVDTRNINIDIQANILPFDPDSLEPGGEWYNGFTVWIDSASSRFDFTWDKPRERDERCKIADGVKSSLHSLQSLNITYSNIGSFVENIENQVFYYTIEKFKEKQLFDMTFKQ